MLSLSVCAQPSEEGSLLQLMLRLTHIQNRYKGIYFPRRHANEQKQANIVGFDDDIDVGYTIFRNNSCRP